MAFLRSLLPRRRPRVQAASAVPAVVTSTGAAPAAPEQTGPAPLMQRHYLEDVPSLLPRDPLAPVSTRTILDLG
ncbi:MAG: hypothetical protein IRZ31_17890 [Thermogemmatispora sp.]|uniref:hypothetical protein n=1 Tax=Thermogemmatispora sp. TaxID=1968838 RepID=UPI00262DEECA|nr:hypothetical protein [Thermogemmatispora sp.]MBX5458767.1 hypothetical protein [Thermogemmatispora sp.]